MDKMKMQENLVWEKHNGELTGYVYLGNIDLNYATSSKAVFHVLVFLIRSIANLLYLVLQILQQIEFQLLKCSHFYGKPFLYV